MDGAQANKNSKKGASAGGTGGGGRTDKGNEPPQVVSYLTGKDLQLVSEMQESVNWVKQEEYKVSKEKMRREWDHQEGIKFDFYSKNYRRLGRQHELTEEYMRKYGERIFAQDNHAD